MTAHGDADQGGPFDASRSQLCADIAAIPDLVRQRIAAVSDVDEVARRLRCRGLRFIITIGRGSSDAVCEAVGRAAGVHAGLIAASLPPSLITLDRARLDGSGALALVVSQSGRSPDIIEAARAVRAGGAHVVGIINAPESPLATVCDDVLLAGGAAELSVAATKSVVLSWLIGLRLAAGIGGVTLHGWETVADDLASAVTLQPTPRMLNSLDAPQIVVLGRGSSLAAAREVALKIKELSGIDADAISSAEVMHGPRAAINPQTALLAIATGTAPLDDALSVLSRQTNRIVVAGPAAPAYAAFGDCLAVPAATLQGADAVVTMAALYPLAVALAVKRGRDPDRPQGLSKITLTR